MISQIQKELNVKQTFLDGIVNVCKQEYEQAETNIKNLYWLSKAYIMQYSKTQSEGDLFVKQLCCALYNSLTNFYKERRQE